MGFFFQLIFTCSVFLSLAQTSGKAPNPFVTKESQFNVILQGNPASSQSREMYLILKTLQQAQQDYQANPEKFKIIEPLSGEASVRYLTQDEVSLMYFSQLVADQKVSYEIETPPWFQLAKHLTSDLTGVSTDVFDMVLKDLKTQGEPPLTWELDQLENNPGAVMVTVLENQDKASQLVSESFKKLFGYDVQENLLMTRELKEALQVYEESQQNKMILSQVGKINDKIEKLRLKQAEWNRQLKAAQDQQAKAKIEMEIQKEIEFQRNEIRSGLQMVSTVMQLTGQPEAAKVMGGISQLAEISFTLMDGKTPGGVELGSLATANLYMSGAAAISSLLQRSGGDSEMKVVMKRLQALFDLLNETRREMNQRFDLVDMRLEELLFKVDSHFQALQKSTERIEENLNTIAIEVSGLKSLTKQVAEDLYGRLLTDEISVCLPREAGGYSPPITDFIFHNCFSVLENNLYKYSRYEFDSLSQGYETLEDLRFDLIDFPYVAALPRVVHLLRNQYNVVLRPEMEIYNPYRWNYQAQTLALMWSKHPVLARPYGTREIDKAISTGEQIQSVYGELALISEKSDRKVIHTELFKKLVTNYRQNLKQALEWMDSYLRSSNPYGVNPVLSQKVLEKDLSHIKDKELMMSACDGKVDYGIVKIKSGGYQPNLPGSHFGIPAVETDWDRFGLFNQLRAQKPPPLRLWPTAFLALPQEIQNLEKRSPGSVQLCLRQYLINSWEHKGETTEANITVGFEAQVQGAKVASTVIQKKIEHDQFIEIARRLNIVYQKPQHALLNAAIWAWEKAEYTSLFKIYWDQNSQQSGLPMDGILASSFKDIAQWQVHVDLPALREQGFAQMRNESTYKALRQQLNETRNVLRVLLEIGIRDGAPYKRDAQSLLKESYGFTSRGLRSLDMITQQTFDGTFTAQEILSQTTLASDALLGLLDLANQSGEHLIPRNRALDETLQILKLVHSELNVDLAKP